MLFFGCLPPEGRLSRGGRETSAFRHALGNPKASHSRTALEIFR
jgi:hypothetical protein